MDSPSTFGSFPLGQRPRYLLRDRDRAYGEKFCETAKSMGIREVLAAPRSPWQNPFAERLVGSIRRECLDHVIVFHVAGLRRILKDYFEYYERCDARRRKGDHFRVPALLLTSAGTREPSRRPSPRAAAALVPVARELRQV